MLSAHDLTRHLSHGDGLVRDHALQTLALAREHAGVDASLALGVLRRIGPDAFASPLSIRELPVSGETLAWLCDAHDRRANGALADWITGVPQDVLEQQRERVGRLRDGALGTRLKRRLELGSAAPDALWAQLPGDRDVLLALVKDDGFVAHQIGKVRPGDPREVAFIELLGLAHIGAALPTLLDWMTAQDEAIAQRAGEAVARIGTAGAVTEIERRCDRGDAQFRRRAAECIARFRVPSAEASLQRLIVQEDDGAVAQSLALALAQVCTTTALDRVLGSARSAQASAALRQAAASLSIMLERAAPESPIWRGARQISGRDFARALCDEPAQHAEPATSTRVAPIQSEARPGRNDPCPCGSGRKYKKCCGGA